jgi:hypothetical protein
MLKKILFSVLGMMFLACPVLAFNNGDRVTQNGGYQELKAYNQDFDLLVFDFTLSGSDQANEALNALTVYNNRSANDSEDILAIKLWLDNGDNLWQGLGRDILLSTAGKTDNRHWIFNNLNIAIPSSGAHFYISMETTRTVTADHKLQLEIERLSDVNGNGIYDYGDTGIFLSSKDNGPTGQNMVSNYVYDFEQKSGDVLGPKANISNLYNNEIVTGKTSFTVTGVAKDRMQGSVKAVKVSFVPSGTLAIWQDAVSTDTNFSSFQYTKENIIAGDYVVNVYAEDWDGNFSISSPITVTFKDEVAVPVVEPVVIPTEIVPEVIQWTGRIVKVKNVPAVYMLVNNKKYWFLNEKVFFQYYKDFSGVEIISATEMDSYELGGGVLMKKGALIKTATSDKVYETGDDGKIRWILNEVEAKSLYGNDWATKIQTISEEYLKQYNLVTTL